MKIEKLILSVLLSTLFFTAKGQSSVSAMQSSLYTFWTAQSQYAGFILAEEDGLYKANGMDLKVIHFDGTPAVEMLQTGKADFVSLTLLDALDARLKGVKLVNILQFSHESSFVVVSNEPVRSLKDLKGQEIVTYRAFNTTLKNEIYRRLAQNVSIKELYSCVEAFCTGAYDYVICTSYNEMYEIEESGFDISSKNIIHLSKCGLNIPEDGIYVMEEFLQNPKAVDKFIKASIEGWSIASQDIEHSVDVTLTRMERENLLHNRYHERNMLKEMLRLHGKDQNFSLTQKEFDEALELFGEEAKGKIDFDSFAR